MSAPELRTASRSECVVLCALLAVFLAINFATATLNPTVWMDEALYTDPAANLHFGRGFTSAAWPAQEPDEFWAGNVPLHPWLLAGWFDVVGFGLLAARSLSFLWAALAAALLWLALVRSRLVASPALRLAALAVLLTGSGTTLAYRNARPDALTMALAAGAALAATISAPAARRIALAAAGVLLPLAGLQMAACAAIVAALIIASAHDRRRWFFDFASLGAGIVAGGAALWALYTAHGVWPQFVESITRYSNIGIPPKSLALKLTLIPSVLTTDKSSLLLFVAVAVAALAVWRTREDGARLAVFAFAALFVIPSAMYLLNKYPVYYSWMGYAPPVLALFALLDRAPRAAGLARWPVAGALAAACAVGLPMRTAAAVLLRDTSDHTAVQRFVEAEMPGASGPVWVDFQAYFAAKRIHHDLVLPPHLPRLSTADRERIATVIVAPIHLPGVAAELGGSWREAGAPFVPQPPPGLARAAAFWQRHPQNARYQLQLFRRE